MPKKSSESSRTNDQLQTTALLAFAHGDPTSARLLEHIRKIAAADSTVLIQGESGTGKDLVASLLHYLGKSPEQPLVKIDCANGFAWSLQPRAWSCF